MDKLTREDLLTLEQYAATRQAFRTEVMTHKQDRRVALGAHLTLYFEDRLTMRYQVQEMLRVERIFEPAEIEAELSTYNPLIPDGANFKATLMIEYDDVTERQTALQHLLGIEDRVWVRIAGHDRVYAIADEDLERSTADKTSAVHFVRFELSDEMLSALKGGASAAVGVDHRAYRHSLDPLPDNVRRS